MIIAISGYSNYLWYLNGGFNNSNNSLLNNLFGFVSLDGILISLHKFTYLVLNDNYSEEDPIMCLLDLYRVSLVSSTNLIISSISVATFLKHFFAQKYLDYGERWSNKIFGFFIVAFASTHLIWAGRDCGLCEKDCIFDKFAFILKISTPCFLLVVFIVMMDSVWGIAQMFNKVRNLFSCNEVTPVIQLNSDNISAVNMKVN